MPIIVIRNNELWMINCLITPLTSTSLQTGADSSRSRKLLMHRKEIDTIIGALQVQGTTCLPVKLFLEVRQGSSAMSAWQQARSSTINANLSRIGNGREISTEF